MTKHFKTYSLPFSDPDLIDECDEVYMDGWPDIEDPCDDSPNGQHAYNALLDPETCIHCGKKT